MNMNEMTKRSPLIRRLSLLLAAILMLGALTPMLTACTRDALTLDGVSIDCEMYAFWFSMSKTDIMRRYGIKSTQDNEAFWSSPCPREGKEGKSWGEVVNEEVHRAIKLKLAAALLYDELGLSMTKGQKNKVKGYLDEMVTYVANGNKGDLKEELALYGSSFGALRRCAAFDLKAELVLSYMARNGKDILTSEEKASFYQDSYFRVKILYINDKSGVYGKIVNGVRVEEPLSMSGPGAYNDADKAYLAEVLDEYYDTGKLPENFSEKFDELLARSDEEIHGEGAYPKGIYVTNTVDLYEGGLLEEAVYEAVFGLTPGQLYHVSAETPVLGPDGKEDPVDEAKRLALGGERYIYSYPLETAAYDDTTLAEFFGDFYSRAASRALSARSLSRIGEVEELSDNYKDITVYTVPCNLDFKLCTME